MYPCKYRIIFDPLHPVTHILLMSRWGGLEDRHECSVLYSTSSFSWAAVLQQRISHLGLLSIHQTFLPHVFSSDLFTSFLLDPEIFFFSFQPLSFISAQMCWLHRSLHMMGFNREHVTRPDQNLPPLDCRHITASKCSTSCNFDSDSKGCTEISSGLVSDILT